MTSTSRSSTAPVAAPGGRAAWSSVTGSPRVPAIPPLTGRQQAGVSCGLGVRDGAGVAGADSVDGAGTTEYVR